MKQYGMIGTTVIAPVAIFQTLKFSPQVYAMVLVFDANQFPT